MLNFVSSAKNSGLTAYSGLTKLEVISFFMELFPGQTINRNTLYDHAKVLNLKGHSSIPLNHVQLFILLIALKKISKLSYRDTANNFNLNPQSVGSLREQWHIVSQNSEITEEVFHKKLTEFFIKIR